MRQSPKQHKIPKVKNWDGGSKQATAAKKAYRIPGILPTLLPSIAYSPLNKQKPKTVAKIVQ